MRRLFQVLFSKDTTTERNVERVKESRREVQTAGNKLVATLDALILRNDTATNRKHRYVHKPNH